MTITIENGLLIGSILLFISIISSKTSYRIGVPTLILFLVVGMLAGEQGPGRIKFNDPALAQILGIIALNFILFSGGIETRLESVRPILWRGLSLATAGVFLTAATVGIFVHFSTGIGWLQSFLLGSIVSSTDASAVFSILRSNRIGLKRHLRPTLELESGSNDPMAFFLTISLTDLAMHPDKSAWMLIPYFLWAMAIGAICGYMMGIAKIFILNRIKLEAEGLYPVLMLALIFFTFSFTHYIGGNGFLAVYISAVMLGNARVIHKKSLIRFYDGQAWLMQIIMFLTLGLFVYPTQIVPIIGTGLMISAFLIFVARPIAVFASLHFFNVRIRDKLFLSWVGLRGAVPIIFATYPLIAGIPKADELFHLVFFISVTSVLLQGTTLPFVARKLKLVVAEEKMKKYPLELELSDETVSHQLTEIVVAKNSPVIGKKIVNLGFPKAALIVLINRNNKFFTPSGATVLEENDQLSILADTPSTLADAEKLLSGNRNFKI